MMLWTTLLLIGIFIAFMYIMTKSGGGCCGSHGHHESNNDQGDRTTSVDNKKTHGSCCGT